MIVTNCKKLTIFTILLLKTLLSAGQDSQAGSDSIRAVELFRQAIEYGRTNNPEKALNYFQESLYFRKNLFGEKHYRLGSTYMGMAIQYKNLYQLENAYSYYRIAEEMYRFNAPENDSRLGDVYTNIGNYYRVQGNFAEAIRYHQRAIDIYRNASDNPSQFSYLAIIYNLAECLHLSNRENEAIELLAANYNKASFDQRNQYLNLMASVHFYLNDHKTSKSILAGLIESIAKEYGYNDYSLADQYTKFGQYFINTGQPDSGLVWLMKAEEIYLHYDNTQRDLGELNLAMAHAWSDKPVKAASFSGFQKEKSANLHQAAGHYLKALSILNDTTYSFVPGAAALEASNFPVHNLRILNSLGRAWRQIASLHKEVSEESNKEFLDKALVAFITASDLALHIRTSYISEESKMLFAGLQRYVFLSAVSAGYDLYQLTAEEKYFEVVYLNASRAKAASLLDNLSDIQARTVSLIPDSLLAQESSIQSNIAYYRERLYVETHASKPDTARIRDITSAIFLNEQRRNDLRNYLETHFREYHDLKYASKKMSIKEMQQLLRRNEAIVEYIINPDEAGDDDGSIFIITVSKYEYRIRKEPFSEELRNSIVSVHSQLSTTAFLQSGVEDFSTYCHSAHLLYNRLIKPSSDIIQDKRITIIPDGILSYLPFEALLTEKPQTHYIHYHDLPYLIHNHAVNYAYSTEIHLQKRHMPLFRKISTLAFAPEYADARYADATHDRLASIPGIIEEVRFLEAKIKAEIYTGSKATEARFRHLASGYDILHMAMHTLINDTVPLFSRLAFFPEDHQEQYNDGWVNTLDIYHMQLNAKLTVLSACNTGTGVLRQGEGVMSLARAFLYAGCPSVVMTLWDIEDRTGTEIMKEFYRNLKAGKSKDVALREAKLLHISQADPLMSHPHFWLGYISIGNTDPLFPGYKLYFFVLLVFIMAVFIADMIRKKVVRKKQTT